MVNLKKYKQLIAGIMIGSIVSGVGVVSAAPSISALMVDYIKFKFDGTEKRVPDGYTVLMYQDRTYVPARFVAENLGFNVGWDGTTSTVTVEKKPVGDAQAVKGYTFSNYSLKKDQYSTKVIGEITNHGADKLAISFKVNFYDKNGKLLGSAIDTLNNIASGETKTFEAISLETFTDIDHYSFQIDTEL